MFFKKSLTFFKLDVAKFQQSLGLFHQHYTSIFFTKTPLIFCQINIKKEPRNKQNATFNKKNISIV